MNGYAPQLIKTALSKQGHKCAKCGKLLWRRQAMLEEYRAVHRVCRTEVEVLDDSDLGVLLSRHYSATDFRGNKATGYSGRSKRGVSMPWYSD